MMRKYKFAECEGYVKCIMPDGKNIEIPVFQGILKHPTSKMLFTILKDYNVMKKYTCEAIRKASWPILAEFPREWLKKCMKDFPLSKGRKKALDFLLS